MYCPRPDSSNTVAHITATPPERDNSSHSDQWAAYNHVQHLASVTSHSTVNHSLHFIHPGTGIHTQNVESYWNRVKGKFKRMKGVHEEMMSSYLDEFIWGERHGPTVSTVLTNQISIDKMHVTANARKLVPTCGVCRAHYLWHTNHSIFSYDSGVSSEDRVLHAWAIFRSRSRLDCLTLHLM